MNVNYDFVVDFARPSKSNTLIISENDSKSRKLHFVLLSNKQPMDMTNVQSAIFTGLRPDGEVIGGDLQIVTEGDKPVEEGGVYLNEVIYTVDQQLASVPGSVVVTITLNGIDGERITSFEFYIEVRNPLYKVDDYITDNTKTGLMDLIDRSKKALDELEKKVYQKEPKLLVLDMDENQYKYDGTEEVEVDLNKVSFWMDEPDIEEDIVDESAAARAIRAAEEAEAAMVIAQTAAERTNNTEAYAQAAERSMHSAQEAENNAAQSALNLQAAVESAGNSAAIAEAAASSFKPAVVTPVVTEGTKIAEINDVGIYAPNKTSELENDSGFLTEHQDISGLATKAEVDALASIVGNAVTILEGV